MRTTTRVAKTGASVLAALAVAAAGTVAGSGGAQAAGACPTVYWGSLAKAGSSATAAPLVGVRAGRHECFDRLVLDVAGDATRAYHVAYVPVVTQDGSGFPVPLRGAADLQITLRAPAYDETGGLTLPLPNRGELVDVTGWRTFRQVAFASTFEGYTTIGLGVRARLPFRVFVLPSPGTGSRVVLDVAHSW